MPALDNHRHERFAQLLAEGRSGAQAYAEAGYKPSDAHASRLAGEGKVQARVAELKGAAALRAELTTADIAAMLVEDREFARQNGHSSAATAATMGLAKLLGLITDKTLLKHDLSTLSDEQLDRKLAEVAASMGFVRP